MNIGTKVLFAALLAAPLSAMAAGNNVGSCGWGSKVFDGQSGVAPQVLAATTNGTFGNQTFGITFGTSGCTQDGAVSSSWKTAAFIDGNKSKLARDMSRGNGETLDALAKVMGVADADKAHFYTTTKQNFDRIFPSDQADTQAVLDGLKLVVASDARLSAYAARI
jgi:hypothetical protein